MSGLFGGGAKGTNTVDPRIGALRIQTSAYGKCIALVYGKTRITGNLIGYNDFIATPHTTTTDSGGGKGGGSVSSSSTSWTYTAAALMGLCEGQVSGIPTVWADKTQYTTTIIAAQQVLVTEIFTIPATPFQVTVSHSADYFAPTDVAKNSAREPGALGFFSGGWTDVSPAAPAATTEYSRVGGTYTFHVSDVGTPVAISYRYTAPAYSLSALAQLGLALYDGSATQSPFGYMTTLHPGEALAYRRLAYVATGAYDLGDQAGMPNHSFEVDALLPFSASIRDANPAAILPDYLSNIYHGVGFPAAKIGDLTQWSNYCIANSLFLSPGYTSQEAASGPVARIAQCSNAAYVYSEGVLKVLPYGDTYASGNGATYTPNNTPAYALTDDDFMPNGGDDPVIVVRGNPVDAFNQVQIQYNNRANQYNQDVVEAKDQSNIEIYGLRPMPVITMDEISDTAVARAVAQIILQRALYIRNTYKFQLGWKYCLLEPMDIVTLTEGSGDGLDNVPVRITLAEENDDGTINIEAEDYIGGISSHVAYPAQTSGGYTANYNIAPGRINTPVIFDAPSRLTASGYELWMAVAGTGANWGGANIWISTDGATYVPAGQVTGASRYGYLAANFVAAADPDTTSAATVDFSASGAVMASATAADADALNTLCHCDGELFSYQSATLIGAKKYTLGTRLRRGAYGTSIALHEASRPVVRLDSALFRYAYDKSLIGSRIWVKCCSYNIYGTANESPADVTPYPHTITGPIGRPDPVSGLSISGDILTWTTLPELDIAGYRIKFQYGANLDWGTATPLHEGLITDSPYTLKARPAGMTTLMIRAVDQVGAESVSSDYVILNMGDALVANVIETYDYRAAGWGGTLTNAALSAGDLAATQSDLFYKADAALFYPSDSASFYSDNYDGMTWITGEFQPSEIEVGSNLTLAWTLTGDAVAIEYRLTGPTLFYGNDPDYFYADDSAQFYAGPSGWSAWPGTLVAQLQGYQWRVTTSPGATAGVLSAFVVSVDVPDKLLQLSAVVISPGGTRLAAAAGQFHVIKNIQLTLQDGGTAMALVIQDRSITLGPMIVALDATRTSVGATIDALIQGA